MNARPAFAHREGKARMAANKSPYWHTVLFVLAPWAVGIAVWLLWVR